MPNNVQDYPCPKIATDIIIEYRHDGKDGIVLIQRKNAPIGLALPGGFAELGLTLAQNAVKEAKEETGLDVRILKADQDKPFLVVSDPARDPRYHVISAVYIGKGKGIISAGDDAKEATFVPISALERHVREGSLVFDHAAICRKYLRHYRKEHMKEWDEFNGWRG